MRLIEVLVPLGLIAFAFLELSRYPATALLLVPGVVIGTGVVAVAVWSVRRRWK